MLIFLRQSIIVNYSKPLLLFLVLLLQCLMGCSAKASSCPHEHQKICSKQQCQIKAHKEFMKEKATGDKKETRPPTPIPSAACENQQQQQTTAQSSSSASNQKTKKQQLSSMPKHCQHNSKTGSHAKG